MFWLDLDELATMAKRLWPLSYQRFNLFSFREKDYFKFSGKYNDLPLKEKVTSYLADQGHKEAIDKVYLLTNVRILGYVFNPVSFYYCYNKEGELIKVLAEVNNTFLEQKPFILSRNNGRFRDQVQKDFYVSPFISNDADFKMVFSEPAEKINVIIDTVKKNKKELKAFMKLQRSAITNGSLLFNFLKYPWYTMKVIVAIHYQALKLWLKRVPYYEKEASDKQLQSKKLSLKETT